MQSFLSQLPRETRDTLFLLLVIGACLAPLAGHVPAWASLTAAVLLLWRGVLAWRQLPLPGPWSTRLALAAAVVLTLLSHRTLLGYEPGVTLISMLLALKTLELRARRDAMVVFFLGFFTLLANFFFSQSLATAAAILLALLGLLTALVNAHLPVGRPPLLESLRTAASMALLGAPIMLVLFLFFPRMAPLWGVPADMNTGKSGLSGQMRIGSVAELALDDSVAMRVRFETPGGEPPPQSDLYFRGPVLGIFDGREWLALSQPQAQARYWATPPPAQLEVRGEPLRYEITLEPSARPWLLTLDAAAEAPSLPQGWRAFMSPELQWLASRPVLSVMRYRAESHLDFRHGPRDEARALQAYRQLPEGLNPRTAALARELAGGAGPSSGARTDAFVRAALQRLRTGGYRYTLEPGLYGEHTADEFWFERKEGFCEHIASAFVVLMRAGGVPARIVTGYQGGQMNAIDGYWTVRQSDAHAWTEVWMPERGWVRVDPTASVAPERIGLPQRLAPTRGALGNAVGTVISPNALRQLRAVWEAMNNRWNQWVLNYTQDRQLDLLRSLGMESPTWEDLVRLLGGLAVASALAGMGVAALRRRRQDPWQRLLGQARARLLRSGLELAPHEPPRRMALRVRQQLGSDGEPMARWLLEVERARYAPGGGLGLRALRRALRSLPRLRPPPGTRG